MPILTAWSINFVVKKCGAPREPRRSGVLYICPDRTKPSSCTWNVHRAGASAPNWSLTARHVWSIFRVRKVRDALNCHWKGVFALFAFLFQFLSDSRTADKLKSSCTHTILASSKRSSPPNWKKPSLWSSHDRQIHIGHEAPIKPLVMPEIVILDHAANGHYHHNNGRGHRYHVHPLHFLHATIHPAFLSKTQRMSPLLLHPPLTIRRTFRTWDTTAGDLHTCQVFASSSTFQLGRSSASPAPWYSSGLMLRNG